MAQRARQLEAAAAHVGRSRENLDAAVVGHRLAGLGGLLPVNQHLARHDQGLRLLAGFREASFYDEAIQARLHDLVSTNRSVTRPSRNQTGEPFFDAETRRHGEKRGEEEEKNKGKS